MWINTKEMLPDGDDFIENKVLVHVEGYYGYHIASYVDREWYINYVTKITGNVDFWMPIPKLNQK